MGGQKRGSVVVITECLPRFRNDTIARGVRSTYGNDLMGTEVVGVADIRHLLRNSDVMDRLTSHIGRIASRDGLRGILVISEGGSHRPAVRLLRRYGFRSKQVAGITVRPSRQTAMIAIAPTDRTLFTDGGLERAVAQAYPGVPGTSFLTVPGGIPTLNRDSCWTSFLIGGLRALSQRRARQVLLIDRTPNGGYTLTGDAIAVQQRINDALPGTDILLADTARVRGEGIFVRPLRLATA